MFKGLANLAQIMKQAQEAQSRMGELKERLGRLTVAGAAGGGLVTVEMNGHQEVLGCRIDASLLRPEDREMVEDLVVSAINEALRKVKEAAAWQGQGRAEESPCGGNHTATGPASRCATGGRGADIGRAATGDRIATAYPGTAGIAGGAGVGVVARSAVGGVDDRRASRRAAAVEAARRLADLARRCRQWAHLLVADQRAAGARLGLLREGRTEQARANEEQDRRKQRASRHCNSPVKTTPPSGRVCEPITPHLWLASRPEDVTAGLERGAPSTQTWVLANTLSMASLNTA